jgi:hypothetical protein
VGHRSGRRRFAGHGGHVPEDAQARASTHRPTVWAPNQRNLQMLSTSGLMAAGCDDDGEAGGVQQPWSGASRVASGADSFGYGHSCTRQRLTCALSEGLAALTEATVQPIRVHLQSSDMRVLQHEDIETVSVVQPLAVERQQYGKVDEISLYSCRRPTYQHTYIGSQQISSPFQADFQTRKDHSTQ